jgi:hypothetical protein
MSDQAWDRELAVTCLALVADVVANTDRIVELLEEADGKETEAD